MISFHGQAGIVDELVRRLGEPAHPHRPPRSIDLVLPPGFGEHRVAREVRQRLETDDSTASAVALVDGDDPSGPEGFVRQLREQWGRAGLPLAGIALDAPPDALLSQMLNAGDGAAR